MTQHEDAAALALALRLAIKRLRARVRAETSVPEGWTISQLSTLARIVRLGPLTASALAQLEHVRPQSSGEIVAALRAGGLVVSEPDPADGRKALLQATSRGREVVESAWASADAWLARAIEAVVAPARRAAFAEAIELLDALAEHDARTSQRTGGA